MTEDVLVAAHGVGVRFGPETALDGVDLSVRRGEVHALVGLNGAGKSTLLRVLLAMVRPGRGHVDLRLPESGHPLVRVGPGAARVPDAVWGRVGHLVESALAYPELTVRESVRCAGLLRGLSTRDAREATERLLDELALRHWADRRNAALSLGNRQRAGLACAVVARPRLLVLDEPTNALDPAGVLVVRRVVRALADEGSGVLVSSHHLDEVARVADRITVLHRGRVLGTLPPGGTDLERAFFGMVYDAEERLGVAS
ncbi:ABC transporter ATP-binding protein [Cellulomonas sp. C5510]|uniref:ABC transporter ATP-binding protein n=1 Tax=Cellulomonas sp. C5510 TaxID=2871170 RepID=UPI002105FB2B|nr:ABC transporter ATP-binding protein [Cellulomonas sp. C5510]